MWFGTKVHSFGTGIQALGSFVETQFNTSICCMYVVITFLQRY